MNVDKEFLVFFETSGNQAYIYATNKLRENIGASELTYRAGTQWVLEAAGFKDIPTANPAEFREWLTEHGKCNNKGDVEVVLATSGKAFLVVKDKDEDKARAKARAKAEKIVAAVTSRAAKEAPGLSITGAIVGLNGRDNKSVVQAMNEVHQRFNTNRDLMPAPAPRFQMLPFCEPCATTGLPASDFRKEGKEETAYALPTLKKIEMAGQWFERIRQVFITGYRQAKKASKQTRPLFIAKSADQLEQEFKGISWLGVVFSDGNGLGQIIMKFEKWLDEIHKKEKNWPDYLSTLRNFSIELDASTETAFYTACKKLEELGAAQKMKHNRKRLPVVPLLLGGDDLTVLVHGHYALPFTQAFLEAFEHETGKEHSPTIATIAEKALGTGRLSAGAGVAIVKSHFPFHSAHDLAESLLKSAKLTKKKVLQQGKDEPFPCSSLDFHILFDTAYSSLDHIRQYRRTGAGKERLWGGPYVVTPIENLTEARGIEWAQAQHLDCLLKRVEALRARDDDGRLKLPSSQIHALREALAQGKGVADARLAEMRWLNSAGLTGLFDGEESLFSDNGGEESATRFLDALASTEFWGKNKEGQS